MRFNTCADGEPQERPWSRKAVEKREAAVISRNEEA